MIFYSNYVMSLNLYNSYKKLRIIYDASLCVLSPEYILCVHLLTTMYVCTNTEFMRNLGQMSFDSQILLRFRTAFLTWVLKRLMQIQFYEDVLTWTLF